MKILISLILLISTFFADEKKLNIGILYTKIFISKKDISTTSKIWLKYMQEEEKFKNSNVIFYEDEKMMMDDFISNKIDILVSNPSFYFKEKNKLKNEIRNIWISSLSKNIYEEYYLIKHINSSISLNNFTNASLYYRDAVAKEWFESYILKNHKKTLEKQFGKITSVDNHSKLIFQAFFNKDDLIVIPKDIYDSLLKLNPQIEKQTVIIKKSEPIFFSAIGITNKNISKEKQLEIQNMLKKVESDDKNIEYIDLMNLSRVFIKRDSDLKEIEIFYNEFFKLKEEFK